MRTSGCANSADRDGTSFPTKGTASNRRDSGSETCAPSSALHRSRSSVWRSPYRTRQILERTCGRNEMTQSWARLRSWMLSWENAELMDSSNSGPRTRSLT